MVDYFFDFKSLLPYLYFFPIYILLIIIFFLIGKRSINNKRASFYGFFMGLSNKEVLSLSFLFLYYYLIIVSIFINEFSIFNIILFILPILLFNVINFYIIKFFVDIFNTAVLFLLLYSKSIFYSYIIDVGNYWYVIVLYVLLCLFIFLYATFVFFRRFFSIISSNEYVKDR